MSAEDIEYIGDYKEFPTKESALDWLDNYLSLDERNNLIRALQQEPKYHDCNTCVNSDEVDGSNCYECVKGMKNNYTPQERTGHWIVDGSVDCYLDKVRCHCSECGKKKEFPAGYDHMKQELYISYKHPELIDNFCPNCGVKMIEPQESEE